MVPLLLTLVLAAATSIAQPAAPAASLVLDVAQPSDPKIADLSRSAIEGISPKISALLKAPLVKQSQPAACTPPQPGGVVSVVVGDIKALNFGSVSYLIVPFTIALKDCTGGAYVEGGTMDMARSDGRISEDDVRSAIGKSADKAFAKFAQRVNANRNAVDNLLKYGLFMSDTEKQAFFTLAARENDDAVVRYAAPWGSAARAGLSEGDSVVSINGRPTRGLSNERLQELLEAAQAQGLTLVVKSSTGQSKTLHIEARDITWYRAHLRSAALR